MTLPYTPRQSFDLTVDLNTTSARTFTGTTFVDKHVRIIASTAIDLRAGLWCEGMASVTIIGGSFKAVSNAASGATDGQAQLFFKSCGAVYLEGLLIDNASIAQGHAILVSAGTALTNITLQNIRAVNVNGVETGIRGTVLSAGANASGRVGTIQIYSFTGSTQVNGRGIYIPSSAGGGRGATNLRNVNGLRAVTTSGFAFYHWLNAAVDYPNGGPITLTNCYGETQPGTGVETRVVWPNSGAATVPEFGSAKYAAVRSTDPLTNRVGCSWPLLQDTGLQVTGFISEGIPALGDFVPAALVGLGYVQGTDFDSTASTTFRSLATPQFAAANTVTWLEFQRVLAGTVGISGIDLTLVPLTEWMTGGPGTVTVTSDTSLTINPTGTAPTTARRAFATTDAHKYLLSITVSGNTGSILIGTRPDGEQIVPSRALALGTTSIPFTAIGGVAHVRIQRLPTGAMGISALTVTEDLTGLWTIAGPGTVNVTAYDALTITSPGGTVETSASREVATGVGKEFRISFTTAGDVIYTVEEV